MSIMEAREKLTRLPEILEDDLEAGIIEVTRRGKPVLALMAWELYEAITETLEVMSDPKSMQALRRGITEVKRGKAIPWKQAKKALSL
jgi:PHD/YefM family antitoxin component YafN of YafNO toxin-antitoxin module